MKQYLDKPCGRCNNHTLLPWKKSGVRLLSLCETCSKYMGVTVHGHADGSQAYSLYLFGGKAAEKKKPRTHRLPIRHLEKNTETVIAALDYWDKHCNTMRYKT